jgi:caa(3)-type oxidase subunit IV
LAQETCIKWLSAGALMLLAPATGSVHLLTAWNSVLDSAMAVVKLALITLLFMHLRTSSPLVRLCACAPAAAAVLLPC